jgi:phosphatidylglycerol:prolipoprotein diacylglycerol transferase
VFPRLIDFGNYGLPTYGVMAAAGLLIGLWMIARLAQREGLDPDRIWNLGILAILSGVIGAKLLLVINEWQYYSANPKALFSAYMLQAGGVFFGGLLGALAVSIWYVRRHQMPVLKCCDVFAPGIALGHAIGRLGCFAAGCCYGKATDSFLGVTFTSRLAHEYTGVPLGIPIHPTQLYEFAVEMANFGILMWLFKRKSFDGQVMGTYLFLYGIARYFLEYLRDDGERGLILGGIMTTTQSIAIALVVAGGVLWLRRSQPRVETAHP